MVIARGVSGIRDGGGARSGVGLLGESHREHDRLAAETWARDLFAHDVPSRWVLLDTETTGLGPSAEVVQVAVVSLTGEVLLDTLVRPCDPIPSEASRIHGITDARVAGAPSYPDVHPLLERLLAECTVVAYNAAFDERMVRQTATRHGLRPPRTRWECAMRQYARWINQWDERKNDYRWHKLPLVALPGIVPHTASGDCLATLHVLRRMAGLAASAFDN